MPEGRLEGYSLVDQLGLYDTQTNGQGIGLDGIVEAFLFL
jgi:hypothetical protein